jgi:thiol:disulfide interchange protein
MDALKPMTRLVVDFSKRGPDERDVLQEWDISGLPTMIFLDGTGRETARVVGSRSAQEIAAKAKLARE